MTPEVKVLLASTTFALAAWAATWNPLWTDKDGAARVLQQAGVKNTQITGYKFFGCDSGDLFHTGFEGTGANGQPVRGVVCSGIFKDKTIRYE